MSEKYNISDFKGHYHLMPNAIMDIVSGDTYKVFSRIYAHGCRVNREPMTNKPISISARVMRKLLKLGFKKINTCIAELEGLNLISVDRANKSAAQYTINWEEVLYLDNITCNLSYEGRALIADACKEGNKLIAPSQLDRAFIAKVVTDYQFDFNEYAKVVTDEVDSVTDKVNPITDESGSTGNCNHMQLQIDHNCNSNDSICNRMQLQIDPNCNQLVTVPGYYFAEKDDKLVLVINLSLEESLLYKKLGVDELLINGQTVTISTSNCNQNESNCNHIQLQNESNCNHMQLQMEPFCNHMQLQFISNCNLDNTICNYMRLQMPPNCNQNDSNCNYFGTFAPKTCKSGYTVNIYNKINKNNNQYERSEYCNIGVFLNKQNFSETFLEKDLKNSEEENMDELPDDKNNFRDFLGEDLENTSEDNKELPVQVQENYSQAYFQLMKKKANTPFFSRKEIESFIDNIENCLDRPDKIFINRIWSIAQELLVEEWQNEDDKIVEEPIDPEGKAFYKDRLFPDIIQPAMEETLEIIEKGYYELNGEKLPVTCEKLDPNNMDLIIDFKTTHQFDEECYILSKYQFKNIYSQPIEEKKSARGRLERRAAREADLAYMRKIILVGDNDRDQQTNSLTGPENAVYCFMDKYCKEILLDGTFEIDEGEYIPRRELNVFFYEISQFGISEKDFFQLVYNRSLQKDTGALMMRERMFDADAIRRMNTLLSQSSIIDNYKL